VQEELNVATNNHREAYKPELQPGKQGSTKVDLITADAADCDPTNTPAVPIRKLKNRKPVQMLLLEDINALAELSPLPLHHGDPTNSIAEHSSTDTGPPEAEPAVKPPMDAPPPLNSPLGKFAAALVSLSVPTRKIKNRTPVQMALVEDENSPDTVQEVSPPSPPAAIAKAAAVLSIMSVPIKKVKNKKQAQMALVEEDNPPDDQLQSGLFEDESIVAVTEVPSVASIMPGMPDEHVSSGLTFADAAASVAAAAIPIRKLKNRKQAQMMLLEEVDS
jgi:hypothetical protein